MKTFLALMVIIPLFAKSQAWAEDKLTSDIIKTNAGDLKITFLGHASLMFAFGGKVIHVDPVSQMADYGKLPKADLILVTHEHSDHFDLQAIRRVRTAQTSIVLTETCAARLKDGIVMQNGDVKTVAGLRIEALPAYNIVHKSPDGQLYHPKGKGNGYVLAFGDKRVYMGGDTENIPETKGLKGIACAFLPMNLPYTMTPEMTADAARNFRPAILYPYHFGDTDTAKIVHLLHGSGIDVRIRNLK